MTPRVHFITGDDFVKFLQALDPEAPSWQVIVRGRSGIEKEAARVPVGEWLHSFHNVSSSETVWCIDHAILELRDRPFEVEIRIPGRPQPIILPHPEKGHPLWDHE